jgi:hypothetical protein
MDNNTFLKASVDEKIDELIRRCRKNMNDKGLHKCFYAFDSTGKMRVIEIKEDSLFTNERAAILKPIVQEKIYSLEQDLGIMIEKVMYIREGYYNKAADLDNSHLEVMFHKDNANEALVITIETKFTFDARIYDLIKSDMDGKKYVVMSEKPIASTNTNKMDPDKNLRSYFKNIIS